MSDEKENRLQPETEEIVISEENQKMIDKISDISETEVSPSTKSETVTKKVNAVEVYVKNTLNKENKDKKSLNVLADEIKELNKEQFIELFQYMLSVFENASADTKDVETEIKKLLTVNSRVFNAKYFEYIDEVLPIIEALSKKIDFSCTPMFSQEPAPAIYGAIREGKDGKTTIYPLTFEQHKQIINAYLSNNLLYYAGLWLYEISNYIPARICPGLSDDIRKAADDAAKEIRNLTIITTEYQTALGYYYCSAGFKEVVKNANGERMANARIAVLENERDDLLQARKRNQDKIQYQYEQIDELRSRNEDAEKLSSEFEKFKVRFEELSKRYSLQICLNENLEHAHQEKQRLFVNEIDELNEIKLQLTEKLAFANRNNEALTIANGNLQSDLLTERIKLANIKGDTDKLLLSAKNDTISNFASFIAEPINHFARAFDCFKKNKEFDETTLEICVDSLKEIVDGLKSFGISPVGEFGAVVPYDRNLHFCGDAIAEGVMVQVEKIGWRLNGDIIKKADVEKVEG